MRLSILVLSFEFCSSTFNSNAVCLESVRPDVSFVPLRPDVSFVPVSIVAGMSTGLCAVWNAVARSLY